MKMLQAAHQRMNVAPPAVLLVESLVESSSTTIASPKVTDAGVCPTSKFATAGLSLARFFPVKLCGCKCPVWSADTLVELKWKSCNWMSRLGKKGKISQPKNRQRRGRGTLPPARSLSPVKTTQTKQAKKRSRGPTQKMTFQVTSGSSTAIYCHRNSLCNNKEMKLSAKGAAFGISEIVSCSINSCVRHRLCCLWQKIGTVPCQSPLRFRSEVLFISHPHFTSVHQSSRVSLGWLVPVSVNRKGQIEPSAFFDEEAEQVRWSFLKIRRRRTKLLRWQTVHCALYVQVARVLVCRNVGAKQMCLKRMLDHLQMKTLLAAHGAEKSSWNQREREAKPQHILWKHKKRRSGSFSQLGLEPNHTGLRAQSLFFLEELCRVKRSDTHKVLKLLKLLQESSQASKSVLPASPNKTSSAQTHK